MGKAMYERGAGGTVCGSALCVSAAFSIAVLLVATLVLAGCTSTQDSSSAAESSRSEGQACVQVISAEEAHGLMTSDKVAILDVRTQEEFDEGHICNAVLLPHDSITEETALEAAPHKDEMVLVYCRTGRRSAEAAAKLVELGYTQVYDFGGIESWPYDVCSDKEEDEDTVENDELPVGVKVVCGKTRSLPEG